MSWVIVDNGSEDATPQLIAEFARAYSWVFPVAIDGASKPTRGATVASAFEEGLKVLDPQAQVIVKVDADVSFPPRYFEDLLRKFNDPHLGVASGSRYEYEGQRWRQRFVTGNTADAQCRAYRRTCLNSVLPFERRIGWDAVDEALAAAHGWRTQTFREIPFFHHRPIAARDPSKVRAWHVQGSAMHYIGYRSHYVVLRALFNARREPQALALLTGFLAATVRRASRHPNQAVTSYFRRQQTIANLPARIREALGR